MSYRRSLGAIRTNLSVPGITAPTALVSPQVLTLATTNPNTRVTKTAIQSQSSGQTLYQQELAQKQRAETTRTPPAATTDAAQDSSSSDGGEWLTDGQDGGWAPDGSGTPIFDMTASPAAEQQVPWWLIIAGVVAVGGVGYYIWKK
jgi:hypothetical protein